MIGREGQKLKGIELQTATKISIPRPDAQTDVITIMGTREGVDKARHQIQLISDEQVRMYVCACVLSHLVFYGSMFCSFVGISSCYC